MLKTVEKLIDFGLNKTTDKKIGNHEVIVNRYNQTTCFYYFDTAIVIIDYNERSITLSNGGWNTISTSRALNDYKRALKEYYPNYQITDEREWWLMFYKYEDFSFIELQPMTTFEYQNYKKYTFMDVVALAPIINERSKDRFPLLYQQVSWLLENLNLKEEHRLSKQIARVFLSPSFNDQDYFQDQYEEYLNNEDFLKIVEFCKAENNELYEEFLKFEIDGEIDLSKANFAVASYVLECLLHDSIVNVMAFKFGIRYYRYE